MDDCSTFKKPKVEPLEETDPFTPHFSLPFQTHPSTFISSPFTPHFSPNSHSTPTFTPFLSDSNTLNLNPNPPHDTLLDEYNRVSDLFNSAFHTQTNPHNSQINSQSFLNNTQKTPNNSEKNAENPKKTQNNSEKSQKNSKNELEIVQVEGKITENNSKCNRNQRSSELVRVTDLSAEDEAYFRAIVRQTRMVYESLRIFANYEEQKRKEKDSGRRSRADLRAASVMKGRKMWLNRDKRIVGAIPGIHIGDVFIYRMELCVVGLHGQPQAGIDYLPISMSSTGEPIATSIIVSGGYEDDVDSGDEIVYTGHGGQDRHFRQCGDQKLESGNLALERSMCYGIEVRVIRGFKYEGSVSGKVFVYDGLYKIYECWFDVGKSGFGVYKYKLARVENQPDLGSAVLRYAASFKKNVDLKGELPAGYISFDISKKKEFVPVALFNDIDSNHEPLSYEYMVTSIFPSYVYQSGKVSGCDCVDWCGEDCHCAVKNGGEFAYDQNSILVRGKPLIFECGVNCTCPPSCRNRVTQKGVKNRFEIFRSAETAWGVRSLDLIQAGSFICEYAGVVLTREQAQIVSMNGHGLVHPNRFSEGWSEWGDLSQIFTDYSTPVYPSIPPLDFSIDVSRLRNLACYMSHSSTPNAMVQFVLYDHNNLMFPHLMLFAMENIPPLREINLDYGRVPDDSGEKVRIYSS